MPQRRGKGELWHALSGRTKTLHLFKGDSRERNSSVAEKEGKKREKREERVLGPVRRDQQRDASVRVAERDRRLWRYHDAVTYTPHQHQHHPPPQKHQNLTRVPYSHTQHWFN